MTPKKYRDYINEESKQYLKLNNQAHWIYLLRIEAIEKLGYSRKTAEKEFNYRTIKDAFEKRMSPSIALKYLTNR